MIQELRVQKQQNKSLVHGAAQQLSGINQQPTSSQQPKCLNANTETTGLFVAKTERCAENVLAAVKQNGLALEYASYKLQADREIVLTAVKQNGLGARVRFIRIAGGSRKSCSLL